MKYKLTNPDKLIKGLGVVVVLILAITLVSNIMGKIADKKEAAEEESSQVVTGRIETFTIENNGIENLGQTKSVGTIPVESVGNQIATYMGAMILSNLENVKTSRINYMYGSDDMDIGYDPLNYKYVVAINAYRGGAERGNYVGNVSEKDITLEVANQLCQYLNENNDGYYFYLIRDTDSTMTDGSRMAKAAKYSADMMITICVNASEEELGGTVGRYYSQLDEWKLDWHEEDEKPEISDEDKLRDAQSKKLAEELMDAAAEGFDMWSRFPELDVMSPMVKNDMISCTIYLGYMTYPFDLNLMTDQERQVRAAEAMGKVILDFLKYDVALRVPTEQHVDYTETVDGIDLSRTGSSDGSTLKDNSYYDSTFSDDYDDYDYDDYDDEDYDDDDE